MERYLQYCEKAADETKFLVKAEPLQVCSLVASNPHTAATWLQIFDAATIASVTLGTTLPLRSIAVPAGGSVVLDRPCLEVQKGLVVALTSGQFNGSAPGADGTINLAYKLI